MAAISLALAVACTSNDEATPTPPATAPPSTSSTAVPSPTAASSTATLTEADLPRLAWTKLSGPPMTEGFAEPFILDIATGDFYSIVTNPDVLAPQNQQEVTLQFGIDGWSDALGLVVTARLYRPFVGEILQATYAARPGQPFRRLQPINRGPWTGILSIEPGGVAKTEVLDKTQTVRTVILDPLTFGIRQTIPDRGTPTFSPNGSYLIVASEQLPQFDVYVATAGGRFEPKVAAITGGQPKWSNQSSSIAYNRISAEGVVAGLNLYDLSSGATRELTTGTADALWSPDDRYVVSTTMTDDPTASPGFIIYEVATGQAVLRVGGSWPTGWADDQTFVFTGNICDTYDPYSVRVDGSGLRKLDADPGDSWVFALTPDRKHLVSGSLHHPASMALTFLDLQTGAKRDLSIGTLSIFGGLQWLDSGRYVVLHHPAGKDGPCFGWSAVPHAVEVTPFP